MKVKSLSHVRLSATPWTVAYQAPPSMGFSRQEYWSALPFPSPGDLPNPGIEPGSPALEADALISEPPGKPCFLVDHINMWNTIYEINSQVRIKYLILNFRIGGHFLITSLFVLYVRSEPRWY